MTVNVSFYIFNPITITHLGWRSCLVYDLMQMAVNTEKPETECNLNDPGSGKRIKV